MSNLFIRGIAYTPAYEEKYDGSYLHYKELTSDFAESCVGLPVYVNHDLNGPSVGRVTNAYISKDLQLMVEIHCDLEPLNHLLHSSMTSYNNTGKPYFKGLSLGLRCGELETKYSLDIVSKEPREVSIVPVGDRPGCHILDFELA